MNPPVVHLVQILIREQRGPDTVFLVHPHETWRPLDGPNYLVLPARKTVGDPFAPFLRGHSLEDFVRGTLETQLSVRAADWLLEEEIEPVQTPFPAVHSKILKSFLLCPVDVWIAPAAREPLRERLDGLWVTPAEALVNPRLAPSSFAVFEHLCRREQQLDRRYLEKPADEAREENPHRLFRGVRQQPSMYALASRWFSQNRNGVRVLPKEALDSILGAGNRAFNLRVADPYLRYQQQGVGFAWSFFTHKDGQDVHVHSAPTVEIYGVLEGRLDVWWKPYHDRGTSAWNHQVVGPGDWVEMDALQCHFVRWLGPGKGVVFKAGPGPLAEVGRLGVKGKTPCDVCPCVKPPEMLAPSPGPAGDPGKPWGISVRGVLRDERGRFLFLRRSKDSTRFAGQWELPGGKLDPGETTDAALRREFREEIGIDVEIGHLLGASELDLERVRVASLFHEVRRLSGKPCLSLEHEELRWVEPADVGQLAIAPTVDSFVKRELAKPASDRVA